MEYTLRPEPIIKIAMKKVFIQTPEFGDIEASTGTKAALPHWGELFKKIS
jgi:hypothetical protein